MPLGNWNGIVGGGGDGRGGGAPTVTVTLDLLAVSLLLSSVMYSFCLALARRKYLFLVRVSGPELDTKKFLILSAAAAAAVRIMSFVGVVAMDVANVRARYSLNPTHRQQQDQQQDQQRPPDKNQSFYDSSMTVLFDLPNAIVISTYVLLTLVWAECSLRSRRHTQSVARWRRRWLAWYAVFNAALYATQMIMYVLVFVAPRSSSRAVVVVRGAVNAAMAGINMSAVVLVSVLYVHLNVSLSGYPFRSRHSEESLRKISRATALWSLSRIVWGATMLVVYLMDFDPLASTPLWSPVVLFLLLMLCEVAPILVLMDYSFLTMIGFDRHHAADPVATETTAPALERGCGRLLSSEFPGGGGGEKVASGTAGGRGVEEEELARDLHGEFAGLFDDPDRRYEPLLR